MKDEFEIIYLANCALFIQSKGTSLLVDGLFKNNNPFGAIEPFVENNIMKAAGRFSHMDGLLFTHCHEDHFDQEKVGAFMNRHPETTLFVPQGPEAKGLDDERGEPGHKLVWMKGELWEPKTVAIGSLSVTFIKTGHITYDYEEHYCILINNGRKSILVTGDMELADLRKLREIVNPKDCTVFFNPIVLGKQSWVDVLAELGFRNIFIYHIPSEEKDFYGYRKMALKNFQRAGSHLSHIRLLLNPMERVITSDLLRAEAHSTIFKSPAGAV